MKKFSDKTAKLFLLPILFVIINSCIGGNNSTTIYLEIERTKEFDEIYYVLLDYFEEEKGELNDYCIHFTRNMDVKWEDHPENIGHAGYKPKKKWCGILLDDRLKGWQLITVITHEMVHILYWCHIPKKEWSEKTHGDDMVWANGGGDFDISKFCKDPNLEIDNINKNSILFKATFELVCLDHKELMEWTKSKDRQTDMRVYEDPVVGKE